MLLSRTLRARMTLVPRTHLEAIGLVPKGRREYALADGRKVELNNTTSL